MPVCYSDSNVFIRDHILGGSECDLITSSKSNDVLPLKVFPNPFSEFLFLEGLSDNVELKIFRVNGVRVNLNARNGERIDLSGEPPGIYFIRVFVEENWIWRKVVKL